MSTLAKASQNTTMTYVPNILPGLVDPSTRNLASYKEGVRLSRYFYRTDPIASTVTNRLAEISATLLVNKRTPLYGNTDVPEATYRVYNVVAQRIQPQLRMIFLSYMISGMAIPQFELTTTAGNKISDALGRTRYAIPQKVWLRRTDDVQLQQSFFGGERMAYLQVPSEDVTFIQNKGMWTNGVQDPELYNRIVTQFPEYVRRIQRGEFLIPFKDHIIYRNLLPESIYPLPYLEPAIEPLKHKKYLKELDRAVASRAIEAFRHIKVGSDEFPADEADIEAVETVLQQQSGVERVYNVFTNHTVDITWVVPPLDTLLSDTKYKEANADIFFALGFPRILTVGETEKSNAADNKIASLGIMATINAMQQDVLLWVQYMYQRIAEENGFTRIPTPEFSPISLADAAQLLQYAGDMLDKKVISRDVIAGLYGTNFETQIQQYTREDAVVTELFPEPVMETPNNDQGTEGVMDKQERPTNDN